MIYTLWNVKKIDSFCTNFNSEEYNTSLFFDKLVKLTLQHNSSKIQGTWLNTMSTLSKKYYKWKILYVATVELNTMLNKETAPRTRNNTFSFSQMT